jgi:hypothetical protein
MLLHVAPALQETRLPQNAAARAAKDATYHSSCSVPCMLQALELELSVLDHRRSILPFLRLTINPLLLPHPADP